MFNGKCIRKEYLVGRGLLSVQNTRLGQERRARTNGEKVGRGRNATLKPTYDSNIARRSSPSTWNDDDVQVLGRVQQTGVNLLNHGLTFVFRSTIVMVCIANFIIMSRSESRPNNLAIVFIHTDANVRDVDDIGHGREAEDLRRAHDIQKRIAIVNQKAGLEGTRNFGFEHRRSRGFGGFSRRCGGSKSHRDENEDVAHVGRKSVKCRSCGTGRGFISILRDFCPSYIYWVWKRGKCQCSSHWAQKPCLVAQETSTT